MPKESLLRKYAILITNVGANVQKGQNVYLTSCIEYPNLTRMVVEECYHLGAKRVFSMYVDQELENVVWNKTSVEDLLRVSSMNTSFIEQILGDDDPCIIRIDTQHPNLVSDTEKINGLKVGTTFTKLINEYKERQRNFAWQWTFGFVPNEKWATLLYPDLTLEEAIEKLWETIFRLCRISEDTDPVEEWEKHIAFLHKKSSVLNEFNFKSLVFKNDLGTDVKVELVKDHVWLSAFVKSEKGVPFLIQYPTEEVFTAPHKYGVNGMVYASKPLYLGVLIKDMWFRFENGEIVDFGAKEGYEFLKMGLSMDKSINFIGEIALVDKHSLVGKENLIFYTIAYDENAACHMAVGNSYRHTIKNSKNYTKEDLEKIGANVSTSHYDFMFGTDDMNVKGITYDNKEIQIMKNGEFVL